MTCQKTRWFRQAVNLLPDHPMYRRDFVERMTPLLKRCRAQSRSRFMAWLRMRLAEMPTEDAVFFLERIQESRLPPEVVKRKNQFPVEEHGDVSFLHVGMDNVAGQEV